MAGAMSRTSTTIGGSGNNRVNHDHVRAIDGIVCELPIRGICEYRAGQRGWLMISSAAVPLEYSGGGTPNCSAIAQLSMNFSQCVPEFLPVGIRGRRSACL